MCLCGETVDTLVLETSLLRGAGSTPVMSTNKVYALVVKLVRHAGLKNLCLEHVGSSPTERTKINKMLV